MPLIICEPHSPPTLPPSLSPRASPLSDNPSPTSTLLSIVSSAGLPRARSSLPLHCRGESTAAVDVALLRLFSRLCRAVPHTRSSPPHSSALIAAASSFCFPPRFPPLFSPSPLPQLCILLSSLSLSMLGSACGRAVRAPLLFSSPLFTAPPKRESVLTIKSKSRHQNTQTKSNAIGNSKTWHDPISAVDACARWQALAIAISNLEAIMSAR